MLTLLTNVGIEATSVEPKQTAFDMGLNCLTKRLLNIEQMTQAEINCYY